MFDSDKFLCFLQLWLRIIIIDFIYIRHLITLKVVFLGLNRVYLATVNDIQSIFYCTSVQDICYFPCIESCLTNKNLRQSVNILQLKVYKMSMLFSLHRIVSN